MIHYVHRGASTLKSGLAHTCYSSLRATTYLTNTHSSNYGVLGTLSDIDTHHSAVGVSEGFSLLKSGIRAYALRAYMIMIGSLYIDEWEWGYEGGVECSVLRKIA